MWMTLKAGIVDLPYGGGKGAIVCDPREMSMGELERLSRGYVRALSQVMGPTKIFQLQTSSQMRKLWHG